MADPSIDPALAPDAPTRLHSIPSNDIFNAFDTHPDPSTYQLAAAVLRQTTSAIPGDPNEHDSKHTAARRGSKSTKRTGPLIRKRSGWNSFYKEQFAIYHANNPPSTKQNARERKGFSAYAAAQWKLLSNAEKEAYVQQANEDDALAVSRPVEKLRRKRAGLLDTLGRIVAELETEFGVESLVFWAERDLPSVQPDGTVAGINEGEAFGIVGSTVGVRYIEVLSDAQLGPHQFTSFVQQNQPPDTQNANLIIGRKRQSIDLGEAVGATGEDADHTQLRKKSKSNISRDYHDAEFRRLLLGLLNAELPPQAQKTRLPRGFFGPYLEKHGMQLVGLPEIPVEIGEGGKIGGWSADALRRNLDAVRSGRVFLRRVDGATGGDNTVEVKIDPVEEVVEEPVQSAGTQGNAVAEEEAVRILAQGAGSRRVRKSAKH